MARVSLSGDVLGEDPAPKKPTPAPIVPAPETAPDGLKQTVAADEPMRKYTVLLSDADHDRARTVTDSVVALAGIRATKPMRGDVLRALYQLADQDADVRRKLAELLRTASGPGA